MKLLVILIVSFLAQTAFSADFIRSDRHHTLIFLDLNDWTDVIKDEISYEAPLIDENAGVPSLRVLRKARWTC